jgi:NAD+ synthase (glutamine-hydrolysing)
MDLANKRGGLVVGTGDLSELAMGWSTFNGDHMSMYNVNAGVPKSLVRYLVEWVARTEYAGATSAVLHDICATPISPELLPPEKRGELSQKTENLIGPYELHDFFSLLRGALSVPAEKGGFSGGAGFRGGSYGSRNPPMAVELLPDVFQQPIQAFHTPGRSQGGVCCTFAQGRLADAK